MMTMAVMVMSVVLTMACQGDGEDDEDKAPLWGQSCNSDWDCDNGEGDQSGQKCVKLVSDEYGFCSTQCFRYGFADEKNCPDIVPGEEQCVISDAYGNAPYFCAIFCWSDRDCPVNTVCDFSLDGICTGKPSAEALDEEEE
ncbi:hypothetical protein JW899_04255 [Candidatus Uhrbacteria bacterium]|nr:hypothetical protein [Candidatus Uhrbacteria bacterium]